MKLTTLLLNVIGLIIALLWFRTSDYDYEPMITIVGFIGTFIGILNTNKKKGDGIGKHKSEQNLSYSNRLVICLIILIGLLLFTIYRFNSVSIIGIKGNNNDNNQIQIK